MKLNFYMDEDSTVWAYLELDYYVPWPLGIVNTECSSYFKCYQFIQGLFNPTDGIKFWNSLVFEFGESRIQKWGKNLEVEFGFAGTNMKVESKYGNLNWTLFHNKSTYPQEFPWEVLVPHPEAQFEFRFRSFLAAHWPCWENQVNLSVKDKPHSALTGTMWKFIAFSCENSSAEAQRNGAGNHQSIPSVCEITFPVPAAEDSFPY